MTNHTLKSFDSDLQELSRLAIEMGGCAELQIADSVNSLISGNFDLAKRVVTNDAKLDSYQSAIVLKAIATIATRQPMAVDLREIVGVLRISTELERIGDLAKNIAKRVIVLEHRDLPREPLMGLVGLANLASDLLKNVLDTYANRDSTEALRIRDADEEIDSLYVSLNHELAIFMMQDQDNIVSGLHLLFCAKNLERVGDHATNIAESTYFIVEGSQMAATRPKIDVLDSPRCPLPV